MGMFLSPADVPDIEAAEAVRLITDAEATALRDVPSLATVERTAAVVAVFRRIVTRWKIEGPAAVVTQTTGPYGVGLAAEKRVGWTIGDDELADLRQLAGVIVAPPGMPRGDFPPDRVGRIFDPRSPSCN